MKSKLSLLLLCLYPVASAIPEPDPVMPADLIVSQVLAYSLRLKSAEREVEAAGAVLAQAGAQGLPTVSAAARAAHYEGLKETVLGPTMVFPEIPDRYSASIGISQPLYTGGRVASQKRSAAFTRDAARQTLAGTESDVVLEALAAYWAWSKAFYSVQALQASVQRTEAHALDMKNMYEAGLATDNDTLATDVLLDQTRLRLGEAERGVALARARIVFLTGADLPPEAIPDQAPGPDVGEFPPESELMEIAATNRPELLAASLDTRAAGQVVRATRAGRRPSLFLAAQYEQARPNNLIFPPEDNWQYDAFAGVVLTWDIFDSGLTRGKTAEARARAAQASLWQQQVEDRIVLEVREARIGLVNSAQQVGVAERARKSAARNLQAATDLWQNGLARHADVLDAHAQLTDAEYELVAGRADVVLARAMLEHASGCLRTTADYPSDRN
ncbi:MAG: TolC family protein [Verrucomicrobia bacterium]|nr:TolC family protein [Verrucomicrobiota bacterium]